MLHYWFNSQLLLMTPGDYPAPTGSSFCSSLRNALPRYISHFLTFMIIRTSNACGAGIVALNDAQLKWAMKKYLFFSLCLSENIKENSNTQCLSSQSFLFFQFSHCLSPNPHPATASLSSKLPGDSSTCPVPFWLLSFLSIPFPFDVTLEKFQS